MTRLSVCYYTHVNGGKISYHVISERPPTVFNPVKTYVMEVSMAWRRRLTS